MDWRIRLVSLCGVWAVAAALVGCETLGLSAPANKLMPTTKAVRDAAPVPAPVPRELARELHPAYVVEPGDVLLVQPAEFDAPVRLPPDQTVFADGTIDLGIYGRPVVAGKTVAEIEPLVMAAVNAKEKPKEPIILTVRIIGRNSKVYYVLGEVNAPGAFPITGRETVLDGIIAGGGLTRRASEQNIVLSRPTPPEGCRIVFPVCYSNIVQLGDTTTNYQLQPGDRIYVPSRGMLEGLLPARCRKPGVCDGPQFPCGIGGGACATPGGCAAPAVGTPPALPPVPPAPAPFPGVLPIPTADPAP